MLIIDISLCLFIKKLKRDLKQYISLKKRNPSKKSCFKEIREAVAHRCSVKKGVLRNFTKFTGKQLCQSLFFCKVVGLWPGTLLKKRLWHRCFPVNFAKFTRTPFLAEHLW